MQCFNAGTEKISEDVQAGAPTQSDSDTVTHGDTQDYSEGDEGRLLLMV